MLRELKAWTYMDPPLLQLLLVSCSPSDLLTCWPTNLSEPPFLHSGTWSDLGTVPHPLLLLTHIPSPIPPLLKHHLQPQLSPHSIPTPTSSLVPWCPLITTRTRRCRGCFSVYSCSGVLVTQTQMWVIWDIGRFFLRIEFIHTVVKQQLFHGVLDGNFRRTSVLPEDWGPQGRFPPAWSSCGHSCPHPVLGLVCASWTKKISIDRMETWKEYIHNVKKEGFMKILKASEILVFNRGLCDMWIISH